MTDLDQAERNALLILFMQSRIDPNSYEAASKLNSDYHSQIPDHLLESAFQRWVNEGFAKANRSGSAPSFRLRRDKFAEAYRRVLELFNASSITIYPDTREILSDINPTNDFPMKEGWKWLTYESDEKPESGKLYGHNQTALPAPLDVRSRSPIDWTKWGAIACIVALPVVIFCAWYFR